MPIYALRESDSATETYCERDGGVLLAGGLSGPRGKAGSGQFKRVEIDVGGAFAPSFRIIVTDFDATAASIVNAYVLGVQPSDGRDVDEIYVENVRVFVRPGTGHIVFDLHPAVGLFHGRYVIGYTLG